MAKSHSGHSTQFSAMITTESPAFTPASIRAEATARTCARSSAHDIARHGPSTSRKWRNSRSPYLAAWRNRTPTVVRSEIDAGSIAADSAVALFIPTKSEPSA
jgi:hypothetical protein